MNPSPASSSGTLAVLSVLLLSLAACGNKGDLIRPPPPEAETSEEWDAWEEDAVRRRDDDVPDPESDPADEAGFEDDPPPLPLPLPPQDDGDDA